MLFTGATPSPIQGTMGKFETTSVQFQSNEMLVGRTMRVDAALFIDNSGGSSILSLSPTWQLNYPGAAGVYPMNFLAADIYKNYHVEMEVIDAYTFIVHYTFLFVKDLDGYVGAVAPLDNNNPFLPGGMYSSSEGIEMRVTDGISDVYQYVPVTANPFCTDNVAITTDGTSNGFTPGQALNLTIEVAATSVSSTFYFGIYQTTSISNGLNFVEDAGLSYAQISNGATNLPNIPNDCITTGTGFVGRGSLFSATVQVDKVCMSEGSCYRAYVVYRQGGQWKSCISGEICATAATVPPIIGDFDCQITDALGNVYNECCVSNAPTCGETIICVTPDDVSFTTLMNAADLPGIFSDYFEGADVFVSDTFPTPSAPGTPVASTTNLYTYCIRYQPPSGSSQVKYFNFRFALNYGTHYDYLDVVVQVGFNGSVEDVDFVATFDDGSVITNKFCAESPGPLTITYDAEAVGGCILRQSTNGKSLLPANVISYSPGEIVLDPSVIAVGDQVCFVACCAEEEDSTPCDCSLECQNIVFDLRQDTCAFVEGMSTGSVGFQLAIQNIPSNEIQLVEVTTSTGSVITSSTGLINQSFTADFADPVRIGYDIVITLENGCIYEPPIIWLETAGSDAGPACVATYLSTVSASSCSCTVEEDNCDQNFASITPSCDPETGEINIVSFESFASPVSGDVTDCSTDGLIFGPCSFPFVGPELTVRREVKFTDDCPDILIEQLIRCEVNNVCQNQISLESNITGGTLTLTVVSSYGSTLDSETIFVSLDGGANFSTYVAPIVLSGGESIVAYAVASFTDGCPDVISNTIAEEYAFDCNYTGYSVTCEFDEMAGTFTATFIGDQSVLAVNNQLYSVDGSNPTTPYPGPVTGEIFLVKWEIALPGCETICLVSACVDCASIGMVCEDPGNGSDNAAC